MNQSGVDYPCDYGVKYKSHPKFGDYLIGDDGSVWSNRRGLRKWYQLALVPSIGGYKRVGLYEIVGHQINCFVHRLVLEAFVGPCPDGMQSCHDDGNPANNRLSNLRWDYPVANMADKWRHGTVLTGPSNPQYKFSNDVRLKVIRRRLLGDPAWEISRDLGVSETSIYRIEKSATAGMV